MRARQSSASSLYCGHGGTQLSVKKKKKSLCFSTIVRKKTEPISRLPVATHEGKCGSEGFHREYKEILSSDRRIVNYKTMMNNDGLDDDINNNTFMITSSYCCVFLMHFIFHENSKTYKDQFVSSCC